MENERDIIIDGEADRRAVRSEKGKVKGHYYK